MQDIFNRIRRVAPTQATVLIEGESGTGKELVARALHSLSPRSNKKFVAVNCAALSPQLMESELFGHEKGSFTGATQRRIGRFEEADGGTLFLDEIGEIDIPTQVKLLRVLAERSIERVGSNTPVPVNVRVIAATNRNLAQMVQDGTFRLDLYQRLNVISLHMPPLRERRGDIVLMANAFAQELSRLNGKEARNLSRPALELLRAYDWPGNVRQLRTAVEHGVVMCTGSELQPEDLPEYLQNAPVAAAPAPDKRGSMDFGLENAPSLNLQYLERRAILMALQRTGGNRSAAAELLGINRRTLQRKMAETPDFYKEFS
jgi:DNA-binding NtrC family response regulator